MDEAKSLRLAGPAECKAYLREYNEEEQNAADAFVGSQLVNYQSPGIQPTQRGLSKHSFMVKNHASREVWVLVVTDPSSLRQQSSAAATHLEKLGVGGQAAASGPHVTAGATGEVINTSEAQYQALGPTASTSSLPVPPIRFDRLDKQGVRPDEMMFTYDHSKGGFNYLSFLYDYQEDDQERDTFLQLNTVWPIKGKHAFHVEDSHFHRSYVWRQHVSRQVAETRAVEMVLGQPAAGSAALNVEGHRPVPASPPAEAAEEACRRTRSHRDVASTSADELAEPDASRPASRRRLESEEEAQAPPSDRASRKHVLMSARFDGGDKEDKARELHQELRKLTINTYMVETTGVGDSFGNQTDFGLVNMKAMIAVCFADYGAKTRSKYSTFYELNYARQHDIPVLPIKLCDAFPPEPRDYDGGDEGLNQNKVFFRPDIIFSDWSNKPWDAAQCAAEVARALRAKGWA